MPKKKKNKEISPLDIKKELERLNCRIIKELDDLVSPYFISTGAFPLDLILTTDGGFGTGCIEIYGAEGIGKSSLGLNIIAEAQKRDLNCFYINIETAINKSIVGCFNELDSEKVTWIEPEQGQAALDAIEAILRNVPRSLIILDSVPACISIAQLDSSAGDTHMAAIARLFNNFMPKLKRFAKENDSILILLNQIRDNLSPYGPREIVPGGHAIKYYCDWRLQLRMDKRIQLTNKTIIGHRIKATTVKNRFMRPYQTAVVTLIYGQGFHCGYDLLDLGLGFGIIEQSGAWYELDNKRYQGQDNLAKAIKEDEKLQSRIKEAYLEILK
jgi:recombination protein RecA